MNYLKLFESFFSGGMPEEITREQWEYLVITEENEYGKLKLDVTQVQQSTQLNLIVKSQIVYEAELDLSLEKKLVDDAKSTKLLKLIFDTLKSILGTLQGSNILMNVQDEVNVLDEYKKLVYGEKMNIHQDLYGMQSKSLELIPFLDVLPNMYTVTDKADGDRHFLFCVNNKVYLINNNLVVRQIHVVNSENFNNTILDGEIIVHNNKQIFLAFDILFDRGVDIRPEINLTTRYLKLKSIMEGLADIAYPWIKIETPEKFSIESQVKYHEANMDKHYNLSHLPIILDVPNQNNIPTLSRLTSDKKIKRKWCQLFFGVFFKNVTNHFKK
jgi:hypothetical protein